MIHLYLPSISMQFSKEKERGRKKNKWTIRKFSPLLTQPRDPSLEIFSNARYIKKKRLEYKRLVTQIPQMLRRKTNLSSVLLKHQAWSPVVATYNFAHEWATWADFPCAEKDFVQKGRETSRFNPCTSLVNAGTRTSVPHCRSSSFEYALHVLSHSEWSYLIFITWKSSLFSNFFW